MHAVPAILALFQTPTYAMSDGQFHWLIAFTGLVALCIFVAAIALVAVAVMVVKLLKTINEFTTRMEAKTLAITDRFEGKMYPLVDNFQDLMNDTVPKIKRVTESVADTTDVYRAKLAQVDALISDTAAKAKRQSDRVDGMVTSTLNAAGSVVGRVEHAVLAPVKQVTAIFSGLRAAAIKLADEYSQPAEPKPERAGYAEIFERSREGEHVRASASTRAPKPVAFEGENIYTGLEDDYHA